MNNKLKIAIPVVAAIAAVGTGVGLAAARSAAQVPSSLQLDFDTTSTSATAPTPRIGGGCCGGVGFMRLRGQALQVTAGRIATVLGITTDELKADLQAGQTLADIATAKSVSQDKLVQTIMAPISDEMDVMVKYGYMTKDQETTRLQQIQKRVETLITKKIPARPAAGTKATPAPDAGANAAPRRPGIMGRFGGRMMGNW
ncbi:MAG: hypothetical protein Q7T05_04475 [Dehalococcoidia bacterium]|nr:hypothetical protein [Dehalococcoidia bacterium]